MGPGVDAAMALVGDIFRNQPETLDQLCLMSGGHMRNLMLMAQEAIKQTDTLPHRQETGAPGHYQGPQYLSQRRIRRPVADLARVHQTKEILNDEAHRELLFNRCILEYRYIDDEGEIVCWRDIHPLLRGVKEFKAALERLAVEEAE